MDIGLGNGFKNKFITALTLKETDKAKRYVSTLYVSTLIISFLVLFIYLCVHWFLDWNGILKISEKVGENVSTVVLLSFILFCCQFVIKNVSTIYLSFQKTFKSDLIGFLSNLLSLVAIFTIDLFGYNANLLLIAMIFMTSPLLVSIGATYFLLKCELKNYVPDNWRVERKSLSSIINLGVKFFIIQVTTIVLFASSNFIITRIFGPEMVTVYNIPFQLFSSLFVLFTVVITLFWAAFTEAIAIEDYGWIKKAIKKLYLVWGFIFLLVALILFCSPMIYNLWIGSKVEIPFILSASFALYVVLLAWSGIHSQFLNGVGKIKVQLIVAICQCVINIPLAVFLSVNLNFGVVGVISAINFNLLMGGIVLYIQTNKIKNNKAIGIWNL